MSKKRGVFFTIDAILAAGILLIVIILVSKSYVSEPDKAQVSSLSQDSIRVFTNLKVNEIENNYVKSLIALQVITKNNTLLEQIGEFWAEGKTELAKNFTKNVTDALIPPRFGVGVYVNGEEIYARSKSVTRNLISSKKIISGIERDKPIEGLTTKVILSGIESKRTKAFLYFGGFEGQGNLTKKLILPDSIISINSSYIEVDAGSNFNLYINNLFSGSYVKGSGGGGDMLADKWNINESYLSNFKSGENIISLNFTNGAPYVAGGFLRVTYETSSYNDTITSGYEKYWLPGIDGFINLYSSFYAPFNLSNMAIFLHFLSEYNTYLTIGNKTIFQFPGSTNGTSVVLNDSSLSSLLDYSSFSEKTVPIRMGISEISLISGEAGVADVELITDRTSSMSACDVEVSCTAGLCDSSSPCHDRRDNVAIQSDKNFINTILGVNGNKVGLVGYGKRVNPVCSFDDITNDNQSLHARLDDYSNEWCGNTCISCGVQAATELLTENEALDELNEKSDIDKTQHHVGDSGSVSVTETLSAEIDTLKFVKSRLTIFGKSIDVHNGYQDCVSFNGNYIGRLCIAQEASSGGWHTCTYPLKPEWFHPSGNSSVGSWVQTTKTDFEAGTLTNVDTATSPGDVLLDDGSSGLAQLFLDNFDDNDISDYSTINGNWNTATESGKGFVLRETNNANTIIYQPSLNFDGSYVVKAVMWNGDNDAAGVAFRVNTADADNLYSCSATSDSAFNAGIWRHDNDISNTPTNNLAGTSWNYVRSRWYNVTITINETSNTIRCIWKSGEAGVELDVTATDDDVRETGSVGFWTSAQDNFKADLLSVWNNPEENTGTVLSQIFDGGTTINLEFINWTAAIPDKANITLQIRTGNTPTPSGSWDNFDWSDNPYQNSNGSLVAQEPGRYVQWLATLQSKNASLYIPILSDVTINYTNFFGGNNITITGGNINGCFETPGDNDDWDFKDVKLIVWEANDDVNLAYDFDATESLVDDGQETANLDLDVNVDKNKMRSAMLEFEAIDVDPSYYDCAYANQNFIGRIDYQKWNGTNVWQNMLFDVPVAYLVNGQNNITLKSGTTSGCERTSGDNDNWRFRNVNLSVRWTNKSTNYDRLKSMLVMSDGEANTKIGDCGSCDPAGARTETIQKACEAHDKHGISIYAVAFGDVSSSAIDTLRQTACCDDCSNFYTSNNAEDLLDIYTQIAQSILNVSSKTQIINLTGENLKPSKLYYDSYIEVNYTLIGLQFGKIPLTLEAERFENNITQGFLTIPPNTSIYDVKVTSYSGNSWTDTLVINDNQVYNLSSSYGGDYSILGDPYIVEVPTNYVNIGTNDITVSTGISPTNRTGGSKDDRAIYTLLAHGFSDFSPVVEKSEGCKWTVKYEDNSTDTIKAPSTYAGSDSCNFENSVYEQNDAMDLAIYDLFGNLDLDKNGLLDIKISEQNLDFDAVTITNVPSLWGPAIVEIRVWE